MREKNLFIVLWVVIMVVGLMLSSGAYAQAVKTLKIGGTMPLNTNFGAESKKCW